MSVISVWHVSLLVEYDPSLCANVMFDRITSHPWLCLWPIGQQHNCLSWVGCMWPIQALASRAWNFATFITRGYVHPRVIAFGIHGSIAECQEGWGLGQGHRFQDGRGTGGRLCCPFEQISAPSVAPAPLAPGPPAAYARSPGQLAWAHPAAGAQAPAQLPPLAHPQPLQPGPAGPLASPHPSPQPQSGSQPRLRRPAPQPVCRGKGAAPREGWTPLGC